MAETARKYLTPAECLELLPVRMAMREFRRRAIDMHLCYKHGHQITLDEDQLTAFIETLKCQTSNSGYATASGKSPGRSKSPAAEKVSASERVRELLG